ncbi:MAG: flagellar export protein FliJ [Magnetovibrionaceae bacterium]
MASDLKNLIKLAEWRVDEKRRRLGDFLRMLDDLHDRARRLEQEMVREQAEALHAPTEAGLFYGTYANQVIARRERIQETIRMTEAEVDKAREELAEEFRDLKKYELAQAARDEKEALEQSRREQAFLDELGMQAHRRKAGGY